MRDITTITLATGRAVDVIGTYEDITAALTPRQLTNDDGRRELRTTDGRKLTVALGAIMAVEEAAQETETRIGFR